MKQGDVRERAFAMPLTSPAYPPGPYRFVNHPNYLVVVAEQDPHEEVLLKRLSACRDRLLKEL